jgi:glycosyltransferase involved in cell wall biosynthesis
MGSASVISVITPTYNTDSDSLLRLWNSLKRQTQDDWEWIVWDDSTDPHTWHTLCGIAADERFRVSVFKEHRHSGFIGDVKRKAFSMARGDILVELDHDDELTPDCLAELQVAFLDEAVGFVFSDWCEILPSGLSGRYPDGWALGFGAEYWDSERKVWVMQTPEINRTTLSHIVSVPNHVRAWRSLVYHEVGGHDQNLPVADDYDLILRTVLVTKTAHLPKLLYIQHISENTAQRQRNELIQRLVPELHEKYRDALDKRFGPLARPA